jgi:hypothetical protein
MTAITIITIVVWAAGFCGTRLALNKDNQDCPAGLRTACALTWPFWLIVEVTYRLMKERAKP